MTQPEDKLMGVRISDGDVSHIYSHSRIDYDDTRNLAEIVGVDSIDDHYSGNVKDVGQAAIDRGYHSVKDGYERKVLVGDATTRDEVHADLDAEEISYTTEDVSPSADEKAAIEEWGATSDTDVGAALGWAESVDDVAAGRISLEEYHRGKNPHRGREFSHPRGKSRGPKR